MRNKLAKNSIAVGLVTLIVTAGLSFSAQGAPGDVAQSNASAITATGLTGIVDSKECTASSPTGTPTVGTAEVCGTGLTLSAPAVSTFDQTASTSLSGNKGVSTADAQVAGTDIAALTTINLSGVVDELGAIDTGTVLDPIIGGLTPLLQEVLDTALGLLGISLNDLLGNVQDAVIGPLTTALQAAIPVSAQIGAVTSTCDATAGSPATGNGSVASVNVTVVLPGDNDIIIPIALGTDPNSALIGEVAPQQLVDGLLNGIEATLTSSLNAQLGPLAGVVDSLQTDIIDPILAQLGPALLKPVGDALSPLVNGTVNKQVVEGEGIEVTALELNVLGSGAHLGLARTSCGPNTLAAADDEDAPADGTVADGTVADGTVADGTVADADNDADNNDADAAADADNQADADVTTTLPATGSPNLLPFWMLGLGLLLFGATVLLNEKRRLQV